MTRVGKRLVDIVGAGLGLLLDRALLSADHCLSLCAWRVPGPIFFRQMRVGRMYPDYTELFMMIKFRTMYVDAETKSGPVWAKKRDPRVTRVGRFLRKTRLDELPQFAQCSARCRCHSSDLATGTTQGFVTSWKSPYLSMPSALLALRLVSAALLKSTKGYDESIEDVRSKVAYDHAYSIVLSKPGRWIVTDLSIVWKTLTLMACGRGQ